MQTLRIRYSTLEFEEFDIHLRTLRDTQQFDPSAAEEAEFYGVDPSTWALFGVVWGSALVLARKMSTYPVGNLRVLEVGCGIALPSLVLNHRGVDVSAADHNPSAEAFLAHNVRLNGDVEIPFFQSAWEELDEDLGLFDIIIGSDLLYQRDQVESLADFVQRHCRPRAVVILCGPGRGLLGRFTKRMGQLGFSVDREIVPTEGTAPDVRVLTFERRSDEQPAIDETDR